MMSWEGTIPSPSADRQQVLQAALGTEWSTAFDPECLLLCGMFCLSEGTTAITWQPELPTAALLDDLWRENAVSIDGDERYFVPFG